MSRSDKSYARTPGAHDDCQTPPYGILPIVDAIPHGATVWEPAAGEGLMATALRKADFNVIATTIEDGQDFFEYVPNEHWDVIVTNPPFSLKVEWIERCFALGKPWALLLPVTALGNKSVQQLLGSYYEVSATFFYPRIDFKMPNKEWSGKGSHFSTFWLSWRFKACDPLEFFSDISAHKKSWAELKKGM